MGVGSVNDRTGPGVITTPAPEATVQPTTVRTPETPTPTTVTPTRSDAFVRDGTAGTTDRTVGTTQEGLAGTSGGVPLTGSDPIAAGERLYATSREQAQQIAANAAARATAETLAVRGEFQYAQEVVQTVQGNPSNEVARRTLTALDGNLKQCDALISDMETRLGAARTLLAQPAVEGDAENGRARAEAQALLGSYRTGSDGQMVDTGSLEDRLAAARDARTTLLLAQASLRSAAEPLSPESKILGRLEGRGGEIERLQALVTSTPADDPRRAEYQHVLEALQSTATQVHGRWQAAHATLADVEKSLGMRAGRDQGAANLVQRLTAVEAQLGISGPRSAADVAAVQARLGTVIQAQHQQAALITSFLRSDAGMTDADLIASGILKRTPEEAVRQLKADNPVLAQQFGLENADPTRLTPQEQQVGTMLALDTDPRALGRGLDRLYAEWRIDPASRNRSQDLTALANLARLGQVGAADGQSLPALRQNFMVGRQVASATEIRALATFVSGRNDSRSLAAIAGDPRVPRDIRLTADKLDHNATTRGMLSRTARDAGATAPGVDSRALGALAERVAAYEYPGEGGARYNGKLFFENFYDPARLDQDVDKLFHAMKGIGTDERTIFGVLGARQPNERQAIVTEYARRMRAEGYKGDDACPTALYNWLRGDLSGWEYGRAVSLMEQRKTGADWANDLRTHPDAIIDNPNDPRRGAMRTPEGRLDYQRQYFNIFRNPYNAQDMGDREGVTRWRQADANAATSLRAYEAAVASGDRNRIRTAEAAFTSSAGEAIAQYKLLSETYSTQLDERVRSLQQWEEGIIVGGVVVAATAATIATAGAASAAGFGAVAAVSAGFAAGTAAGTAVGFGLRVEQEALHTGGLGNMNWNRIGERTFGDFKMAAGSAIAAAIPTVGLARLQQAAWFVGRTATVGTAMAETANAATTIERVALTARLANIGKNAAATGVLNTAGSFSMRGVHWAANTIAGVQQDQSPDLAFSWQNLFIEMGSGAAMGAANPFLANLTNAERATTMLGRATARGSGFAFDMSINLADATARNAAYGRDPTEGLTQSLLIGAPANLAGGIAGRRAALQAGERSQRARTVLGDPGELRGFVEFAQKDPTLRTKFVTPDGQLSPTARVSDFELAVTSWDRSRATTGRTATPAVETPVARPTADVTENPVARPATEVTDGPFRTPQQIADGVRNTDFGRRVQDSDTAGAQLELMQLSAELTRKKGFTWEQQKVALESVGIDVDSPHSLRTLSDREKLLTAYGVLREIVAPTERATWVRTTLRADDVSLRRLATFEGELGARPTTPENLAQARRAIQDLLAMPEARRPEALQLIEATAPRLLQQLRMTLVHASGPRLGWIDAAGRVVIRDVNPTNARDVLLEVKTVDRQVRGDSYDLRTAILIRSNGQIDGAAAYTYAPDIQAAGGKRYLDNPESWLPQRRAFHDQVIADALAQARALDGILGAREPTVYALRGNTAVGKTRSLTNIPELAGVVGQIKAHANSAVNPDNFKLEIIKRPGEGVSHQQAHAEAYLSRRMTAALEGEGRTRLVDRRLGEVGDIREIFASADSRQPPMPVKLYDIDASLEVSLVGVLTRKPGGSDPIPPFEAIANGFKDARMNRREILEMFAQRGGKNRFELFATDANQSKHSVAVVENGELKITDPARAEHLFDSPTPLIDAARTRIIDDAFIQQMAGPLTDAGFAKVVRQSLERYRGMTLEQALTAHGQARPE